MSILQTRAFQFTQRLRQRVSDDAATDRAAGLSYYFVFALFPFLFFLVTLAAYLPLAGSLDQLMARLQPLVPEQAMKIIGDHLHGLLTQQRPHLLTFGILLSLWSASRAVDALRTSLNFAYHVKESRPFWKTQGMALGLTILTTALMLTSVAALALGSSAGLWLAERLHLDRFWPLLWGWLRWPFTALGVMLVFALLYYFLPDVKQRWRFFTPGAVSGTLMWLIACWGFSIYAENFASYNRTYGSIGGVIVLLTWLYLTGLIFVLGGEINALTEQRSPQQAERPAVAPPGPTKSVEPAGRRPWRPWRKSEA